MEKIIVGLIRGRHEMPVNEYILDGVEDVFDFRGMEKAIFNFIVDKVGVVEKYGPCLNSADYTEALSYRGERELVVYVTGLTAVSVSLVKVCSLNGVHLTLMHYNSATGEYVPQVVYDEGFMP